MDSNPVGSVNKSTSYDTLTAAKSARVSFGSTKADQAAVVRMNTGTSSAAMATDEGRVRTYACFIA
jgi:hypothetical protein